MINLKRNIIKVLMLVVVATFNCCIPSVLASNQNSSHEIDHSNQHCPAQEKPDLDAIHTGSTSIVEEIQENTSQDYQPKYISYSHKSQATYKQTLYQSSPTPVLRLWGSSSELSGGIFRL